MTISTTFSTGRKANVNTAAVQMTSSTVKAEHGVLVRAGAGNSGKIYVGNSSAVTANSADATDGFPLAAGESVVVKVRNADGIYLIADGTNNDDIWWMLV